MHIIFKHAIKAVTYLALGGAVGAFVVLPGLNVFIQAAIGATSLLLFYKATYQLYIMTGIQHEETLRTSKKAPIVSKSKKAKEKKRNTVI